MKLIRGNVVANAAAFDFSFAGKAFNLALRTTTATAFSSINISLRELANITSLVVICYSFPFFNREVDETLFNRLSKLGKIYVQDLNPNNIIETMQEFIPEHNSYGKRIEVIPKRNIDQFVFPKELDVIS